MKLSVAEKASGSRICLAGLGFTTRKDVTWIRLAEMVELFVISLSFFFFFDSPPSLFLSLCLHFFSLLFGEKIGGGKTEMTKALRQWLISYSSSCNDCINSARVNGDEEGAIWLGDSPWIVCQIESLWNEIGLTRWSNGLELDFLALRMIAINRL